MSRGRDNLERAIDDLREEYKRVKSLEFVRDPLGYALYQIWKKYNGKERRDTHV